MAALIHAMCDLSVSVSLVRSANGSPTWVVRGCSAQNSALVVMRSYAAVGVALGFAAELLAGRIRHAGAAGDHP